MVRVVRPREDEDVETRLAPDDDPDVQSSTLGAQHPKELNVLAGGPASHSWAFIVESEVIIT